MFKNMQQMRELMKQAQAMQDRLKREMESLEVEATSGGGMVTVKMNGAKALTHLHIDPEVVNPDDVAMLQDLILAAVNEAIRKVDEHLGDQLGGLGIPGLS